MLMRIDSGRHADDWAHKLIGLKIDDEGKGFPHFGNLFELIEVAVISLRGPTAKLFAGI